MNQSEISEIISKIPAKPGIYIMKDASCRVIYIGKSRSLKKRVKSYFAKNISCPKTRAMVSLIASIEYMVTNNETEALILENNLIKKHKPKYNILLKDSKTHPYIRVTLSEDFPRLEKVRNVKYNDKNLYFGPFPSGYALDKVIEMLSRNYSLCSYRKKVVPLSSKHKSCLKYSFGHCLGACQGRVKSEDYKLQVMKVVEILSGRQKPDFKGLNSQLESLISEFRYEEAAELRDIIKALHQFFESQHVEFVDNVNYDFWGICETFDLIIFSVFFIRSGKLMRSRNIEIDKGLETDLRGVFATVLGQFYEKNIIPSRIYSKIEPSNLKSILEVLGAKVGCKVDFKVPKRGKYLGLLNMANKNAGELMKSRKSENEERISDSVIDLAERLKLKTLPVRIECVDISHIQGVDPVASLVVFINGKPKKSEYRLFHIKNSTGGDDPASIAEVTRRRFTRQIKEGAQICDLYIVDGGIAQVRSASAELNKLEVDVELFGLAKRDELLVRVDNEEVKLPFSSAGMRMIIKLRNEAHRFANSFQKKVHSKSLTRSSLLKIPGVGKATLQKLIWQFGSIKNIVSTKPEEIYNKTGISKKICAIIVETLSKGF